MDHRLVKYTSLAVGIEKHVNNQQNMTTTHYRGDRPILFIAFKKYPL